MLAPEVTMSHDKNWMTDENVTGRTSKYHWKPYKVNSEAAACMTVSSQGHFVTMSKAYLNSNGTQKLKNS